MNYNQTPRGSQGYQKYGPVENAYPQQPGYEVGPRFAAGGNEQQMAGDGYFEGDLANPSVAKFAKKVYAYFASALAVATGASVGGFYATEHFLAAGDVGSISTMRLAALGVFFASFLVVVLTRKANSPLKTGLLYVFASSCGVMVAPMLTFFMQAGMGMTIVCAFGIAATIWGGITVYVLTTGKDFRGLGGYLFVGILLVIGIALLNIFVPFPSMTSRLILIAVLVLFIGYTLYDTSRVTRDYYQRNDASGAALMLFYDFFILFQYLLMIMGGGRR